MKLRAHDHLGRHVLLDDELVLTIERCSAKIASNRTIARTVRPDDAGVESPPPPAQVDLQTPIWPPGGPRELVPRAR
jgi:hypothetical protein